MTSYDEYSLANDLMEKESDRYWNRSNIMLLIQGALIALYGGVYGKNHFFSIAISLQGIIFTVLWLGIVRKGSHYIRRWVKVISDIETTIKSKQKDEFFALRYLNDAARIYEKKSFLNKYSTTQLMKFIIISILFFWLGMLIAALFNVHSTDSHFDKPQIPIIYLNESTIH